MQSQWTLYVNALAFGTIALGLGLPPAINHYLAAGKISKEFVLGQLFSFSFIVSLFFLGILLLLGFTNLEETFLPQIGRARFVVFGLPLHLFFMISNQLLASVLLAEKRYTKAAKLSSFGAVALLLSYAVCYVSGNYEAVEYFFFFIVLNIIILFIQTILYVRTILKDGSYSLRFRNFDLNLIRLLVSFALLPYGANFIQFLNYKMDIWFINTYVEDESKLGIYAVAVSLGQLIWLVPNAFHSVIFTRISEGSSEILQKAQVLKWSKLILVLAFISGLIGYLLSLWLVPCLFGSKYKFIISIFPYLLPGIILFTPSILWSAYIAGKNRIDINLKASLLGFIFALIGSVILIPIYGVIGAALASSISYFFSCFYTYFQFRKLH